MQGEQHALLAVKASQFFLSRSLHLKPTQWPQLKQLQPVPKSVNLKSLTVVVNVDEEGVTVVGGVGGAAREVLVMLLSMDRNKGHIVASMMLL